MRWWRREREKNGYLRLGDGGEAESVMLRRPEQLGMQYCDESLSFPGIFVLCYIRVLMMYTENPLIPHFFIFFFHYVLPLGILYVASNICFEYASYCCLDIFISSAFVSLNAFEHVYAWVFAWVLFEMPNDDLWDLRAYVFVAWVASFFFFLRDCMLVCVAQNFVEWLLWDDLPMMRKEKLWGCGDGCCFGFTVWLGDYVFDYAWQFWYWYQVWE